MRLQTGPGHPHQVPIHTLNRHTKHSRSTSHKIYPNFKYIQQINFFCIYVKKKKKQSVYMDRQGQGWYESKHIIISFLFRGSTGVHFTGETSSILAYSIAHHTLLNLVIRRKETEIKIYKSTSGWLP